MLDNQFPKPNVVVSKCLGFEACNYNGHQFNNKFISMLKQFVNFIPVCPETAIGLPSPRQSLRLIADGDEVRLVQPAEDRDLTGDMLSFSHDFLNSLNDVEGFILKERSPSCGLKDIKIYHKEINNVTGKKTSGLFAGAVLATFPDTAIESEGRLTNLRIREHFLTRLFTLARFRETKKQQTMGGLVNFQTINKFLFMAYNQKEMRILGKIAANNEKLPVSEVFKKYEKHLNKLLSRPPRYNSNINVLMHGLGYFSDELTTEEKAFFLDTLQKFRNKKVPLSVPQNIIRSWAIKYKDDYLLKQTYFAPFPEELIARTDSGTPKNF
ncbi:YbgA family protein [Halothermothrix orenii]|uniref:Uncharacterized conserved protein n=1 Tax=Halothermothrix orenii (strain H 168 / OCM 544 / DSM 9562) TaxID=373903 RepID=B8D229_HALOH|nr:DUF523 and DUF1722 domain-containing protein [Halothermothrix orenii]ACL69256.1 uncharacterized conserved protein [Halothermothrix orenii H 168]